MTEDRCVTCGQVIPEGRQVCPTCENKKIEKVKKGLKCCSYVYSQCEYCPYEDISTANCVGVLMEDALSIIDDTNKTR